MTFADNSPASIARCVERHERILYGGNGDDVGVMGRLMMIEKVVAEWEVLRKEQREDARRVLTAVLSNVLISIIAFLAALFLAGR